MRRRRGFNRHVSALTWIQSTDMFWISISRRLYLLFMTSRYSRSVIISQQVCSVSNSHLNVYVCLVCGKYFQGRARGSPAYFHALEYNHHVFMKLDSGRVFCIPDNYEVRSVLSYAQHSAYRSAQVVDTSLADIKFNLNPTYAQDQVDPSPLTFHARRQLGSSEAPLPPPLDESAPPSRLIREGAGRSSRSTPTSATRAASTAPSTSRARYGPPPCPAAHRRSPLLGGFPQGIRRARPCSSS